MDHYSAMHKPRTPQERAEAKFRNEIYTKYRMRVMVRLKRNFWFRVCWGLSWKLVSVTHWVNDVLSKLDRTVSQTVDWLASLLNQSEKVYERINSRMNAFAKRMAAEYPPVFQYGPSKSIMDELVGESYLTQGFKDALVGRIAVPEKEKE